MDEFVDRPRLWCFCLFVFVFFVCRVAERVNVNLFLCASGSVQNHWECHFVMFFE